jgi:hypothetical protein
MNRQERKEKLSEIENEHTWSKDYFDQRKLEQTREWHNVEFLLREISCRDQLLKLLTRAAAEVTSRHVCGCGHTEALDRLLDAPLEELDE